MDPLPLESADHQHRSENTRHHLFVELYNHLICLAIDKPLSYLFPSILPESVNYSFLVKELYPDFGSYDLSPGLFIMEFDIIYCVCYKSLLTSLLDLFNAAKKFVKICPWVMFQTFLFGNKELFLFWFHSIIIILIKWLRWFLKLMAVSRLWRGQVTNIALFLNPVGNKILNLAYFAQNLCFILFIELRLIFEICRSRETLKTTV